MKDLPTIPVCACGHSRKAHTFRLDQKCSECEGIDRCATYRPVQPATPQEPSLLMELHAMRAKGYELVQAATHLMERISGDIYERTPYLVGANARLTREEELRALPSGAVVRTKGVVYVKTEGQRDDWLAALGEGGFGETSEWLANQGDGIAVLHEGKY